ncbi:MAG: hypothetical protein M1828_007447 [Chrysothrix sp. TS-e1954]|nr:MAG: hypothetical protein M1828_007447 [Chrysothrix sp. TS-e1954]
MHSFLALAALEALTATVVSQKVMPLNLRRNNHRVDLPRKLKRATVSEPIGNAQSLYYANVTVGTPPQMIQLQLDTGSSDVWVTGADDNFCNQGPEACPGGTFASSQSSTYKLVDEGGFNITYIDGSGSVGDYFTDVFAMGDTSVDQFTMGVARKTSIGTGIIGTSFAADESVCQGQELPCKTYPTLLQALVKAGKINSQAYSLWLDDLEAETGTILLGGVDSDKYVGDLITLPVQRDAGSDAFTSFTIAWTGFSIGTPNGEENNFVSSSFLQPAILDSGTTTLVLQDNLFNQLATQFGAIPSQELGTYVAPCYLRTSDATLDFAFGGSGGPTIKVPVSEFLLDLGSDQFGNAIEFDNGDQACQFGMQSNGANDGELSPIIFGDTFLRSAYVVYDLDNKQISLAQSNFNSDSSNVKEIAAGSSSNVPGVATTISGPSLTAAVTGPAGQKATETVGAGGNQQSINADNASPPLASFTTASYTGQEVTPQPTGGSSSGGSGGNKGAAAVGISRPEAWAVLGATAIMSILGSGLLLL